MGKKDENDPWVNVKWVKCSSCDGTGYQTPPPKWEPGKPAPSIDCQTCNGHGGWWEDGGGRK